MSAPRFLLAFVLSISCLRAQTGSARIRVTDATKSVIPRAEVSLLDASDQPIRTLASDTLGETVWSGLPLGETRFRVSAPGFASRTDVVTIRADEEQNIELRLDIDLSQAVCILTVEPAAARTVDSKPPQPTPTKRHWWQIFH